MATGMSEGTVRLVKAACIWIAFVAAVAVRLSVLDFESVDYRLYLSNWYDHFIVRGRWDGLGHLDEKFASYPPIYMTLVALLTFLPIQKLYAIKSLSILFDFLAAHFAYRIAATAGFPWITRFSAFGAVLFLPSVILNSAVWGQCDMMYTTCFLWSFYSILKMRPASCMIAFGFAISLKPQAVFFMPFLAALFISGRIKTRHLLWPPLVYIVCGIPQILAGRPVTHVLLHWFRVENLPGLALGAPNWYQWIGEQDPNVFSWPGIILACFVCALSVVAFGGVPSLLAENRNLIQFAVFTIALGPFFLPGMHERYFFAVDVFTILYALWIPSGWWLIPLMQVVSVFSYTRTLFAYEPLPGWFRALLASVVLLHIGRKLFADAVKSLTLHSRSE